MINKIAELEKEVKRLKELNKTMRKKHANSSSIEKILSLQKTIEKQEKELAQWDWTKKEYKAIGFISDATKLFGQATVLLEDPRGNGVCPETAFFMIKDLHKKVSGYIERQTKAEMTIEVINV